ncbi:hypothetical protein BJ944DRAFT_241873 [Cunninghamella echinulata]|nr:hypothetical protein BJ944DRAFT_241873 [Cunninghamella echinulata]
MKVEKNEENCTWLNPFKQTDAPFLSQLADVFIKSFAYAHVTRKEALNIIGFMLSNYPISVHEQLLDTFIQLEILQLIPSSIYYRILDIKINGVFTPILQCYSQSCSIRQPCYSPTCNRKSMLAGLKQTSNSWLELIPKNILEKTHRHEILRQAALADLLRMEQSYVADLTILDTIFAKPLLQSTCINEGYRTTFQKLLFGNYKSILKSHLQFIKALVQQSQKKNYIFFENVGTIILDHINNIVEPYIIYTGNHIHATYVLQKEIQRNPIFTTFLESQIKSSSTRRLDISHFLTAPTLYIGKFRMLVEAIVKRTCSASEDMPILQQCVTTLHQLLLRMNEAATESGYRTRRTQVMTSIINSSSSHLFGCNKTSFPPHVSLLCEGKINFHRSALYAPSISSSTIPCHAFLFDHMLFITQSKMMGNLEEYVLISKPIPLAAMICLNEEDLCLNHPSPYPHIIHRLSRHVASKLAKNRPLLYKRKSLNASSSLSPPPPSLLLSSTSTPIDSIFSKNASTKSIPSASSSRLRQRLRASVRLSSPVYSLSSSETILKKQQSVPELSLFNNNNISTSLHIASIDDTNSKEDDVYINNNNNSDSDMNNTNNNDHHNVAIDDDSHHSTENTDQFKQNIKRPKSSSISYDIKPNQNYRSSFIACSTTSSLRPKSFNRSRSSSTSSSTNNSTINVNYNNNNNNSNGHLDENNHKYNKQSIYFIHAGSMDTIFGLEFNDIEEYQHWKDQIQQSQLLLQPPFSLTSIWEMTDYQLKFFTSLKQQQQKCPSIQKKISFKKYSSSFSSLPLSPSTSSSLSSSLSRHSLTSSKLTVKINNHEEGSNTIEIYCALPYESIYNEKMVAVGTQDGVWIGLQQNFEHDSISVATLNKKYGFIKIISLEACHRLVLIEGMLVVMSYDSKQKYMLVAYPLLENDDYRDILVGNQSEERKSKICTLKKRWVTVKRNHVISMVVGKLYHQTVLVYLSEYGPHLLAVVAIPKRSHAPWFKKVKEYNVCLKDANQIFLHNNTIYIQSNKYGVVSLVPSLKRETIVDWKNIIDSPCITYVPVSPDYGLVITSTQAIPVKVPSSAASSRSSSSSSLKDKADLSSFKKLSPFNFETQITFASISYPYLLAFGQSLLEIWNIETTKMVQVIQSPYTNCLYDSSKSIVFNDKSTQDKQQYQPTILLGPTSIDSISNTNSDSAIFQIYQLTTNTSTSIQHN